MLVKDVMNGNPVYVEVPSNRRTVLSVLLKNEVSSAPVIRRGKNTLAGIISINELMSKSETDQTALLMNNKPPKIRPKDPIQKAAKAIVKSGFRAVPVVDDEGKLVGIVSVEDLLSKIESESLLSDSIDNYLADRFASAWIGTPIAIGYKVMKYAASDTIMLLNDSGRPSGFLMEFDFLRELEEEYSSSKSLIQASSEGEDWDWSVAPVLYMGEKSLTFPNKRLSDLEARKLPVVPSGTPVRQAVQEMLKNSSPQVAVGSEKEIEGLVFDVDLVKNLIIP
ncbi:CBS domain-containing protein [Tardisphaera miroshnichenkoae]